MSTRVALEIKTAELAGSPDKPSEDRIFTTDNAVIVLDGATDPIGHRYTGGWMADQVGTRLQAILTDDPSADLVQSLESVVRLLADQFDLAPGQAPSTTLAVVRVAPHQADVLVVADSPVIVKHRSGTLSQVRDDRISEVIARYPRPPGLPDFTDPAWSERHQAVENHRNQPGGFWAVSATPEVAHEAITATIELADFESALILTDGVSVLGDVYDERGWEGLYDIASTDPEEAVRLAVEIERSDASCTRWPRSKVHDDKAVASMRTLPASSRSSRGWRYFRRRWEESRGDEFDHWGQADYLFETDSSLRARRQIEIYDRGQRLTYGPGLDEDEYGHLVEGPVFPITDDADRFEISQDEFELEWREGRHTISG